MRQLYGLYKSLWQYLDAVSGGRADRAQVAALRAAWRTSLWEKRSKFAISSGRADRKPNEHEAFSLFTEGRWLWCQKAFYYLFIRLKNSRAKINRERGNWERKTRRRTWRRITVTHWEYSRRTLLLASSGSFLLVSCRSLLPGISDQEILSEQESFSLNQSLRMLWKAFLGKNLSPR